MEVAEKDSIAALTSIYSSCNNHRTSADSYTSPSFVDLFTGPLTIDDIPMECSSSAKSDQTVLDPVATPWEDSIKDLVLDLTSIGFDKTFSVCMLLTRLGHSLMDATIELMHKKYVRSNTTIVSIVPKEEKEEEFEMNIIRNRKVEQSSVIQREYLVTNLLIWYEANDTLILCHDPFISVYKQALEMMPETIWSISCNVTNFVNKKNDTTTCKYACPVYSHPRSMETRAVGSGPINFSDAYVPKDYIGKMNYYLRSIRGSKHSSGRCYDCQVLYKTLLSLGIHNKHQLPDEKVQFDSQFLISSRSEGIEWK